MDTKLEVVDGAVKITAGMKVTKLEAPFDTSTSVPVADSFSPDISALVDTVGIVFGIVIPFSSGVSNDRKGCHQKIKLADLRTCAQSWGGGVRPNPN